MSQPFQDRALLVTRLQGLDSVSLTKLINLVPGAIQFDSPHIAVAERVYRLLSYVESPSGPGLTMLSEMVEKIGIFSSKQSLEDKFGIGGRSGNGLFEIEIRLVQSHGPIIVAISGDIEIYRSEFLRERLILLFYQFTTDNQIGHNYILDMSNCSFIDSRGLGTLINFRHRVIVTNLSTVQKI
jgi:anti-anti-sigma factor